MLYVLPSAEVVSTVYTHPVKEVKKTWKKVIVNHAYTFETDLDVQLDDFVLLCHRERGPWIGRISSLTSSFTGPVMKVVKKMPNFNNEKQHFFNLYSEYKYKVRLCDRKNKEGAAAARKIVDVIAGRIGGWKYPADVKEKYQNFIYKKYFEDFKFAV
jgi:hypothetical protein